MVEGGSILGELGPAIRGGDNDEIWHHVKINGRRT